MPLGNWTEANTLRFLLYVVEATGVSPASDFSAIAEKMGPEFTTGALKNKWQRLKAQTKEGGKATTAAVTTATQAKRKNKNAAYSTPAIDMNSERGSNKSRKRKANHDVDAMISSKKSKVDEQVGEKSDETKTELLDEV